MATKRQRSEYVVDANVMALAVNAGFSGDKESLEKFKRAMTSDSTPSGGHAITGPLGKLIRSAMVEVKQ